MALLTGKSAKNVAPKNDLTIWPSHGIIKVSGVIAYREESEFHEES